MKQGKKVILLILLLLLLLKHLHLGEVGGGEGGFTVYELEFFFFPPTHPHTYVQYHRFLSLCLFA